MKTTKKNKNLVTPYSKIQKHTQKKFKSKKPKRIRVSIEHQKREKREGKVEMLKENKDEEEGR